VRCSGLQCVAVGCSVLQCVAVRCIVKIATRSSHCQALPCVCDPYHKIHICDICIYIYIYIYMNVLISKYAHKYIYVSDPCHENAHFRIFDTSETVSKVVGESES